jgi:hypothetical protein
MLKITVGATEIYDEETRKFTKRGGIELELEHSLVSLSKWEQFFEKPFLTLQEKTIDETKKYIEFMILTPDFSPEVLEQLSQDNYDEIEKYISAKMTATTFNEPRASRSAEIITSELIYYWLITFKIPFEVQYWHLNRLFTLVKVCNIKTAKQKPMSRSEVAARQSALNEQRRRQLGTRG